MPEGDVETYHSDGRWRNRIIGHDDLPGEHPTREAAAAEGRDEARQRKVEHIVRRLDGTFGERNSYGNDPRNIPG
jgi:hypothetical protein